MLDTKQAYYNKNLWPDQWKITNPIPIKMGSSGTEVYQVIRKCEFWNEDAREVGALKIIHIVDDIGSWENKSKIAQIQYQQKRERLCTHAANEIWLMYQLRACSNVVTYSDYKFFDWKMGGQFGTSLAIRMDYLQTLSDLENIESFSEKKIIRLGIEICNALIQCHSKNIIHRDIKPQNIFRNGEGTYLLGDFGISKIIDMTQAASTHTSIGTRLYAAPEQFKRKYGLEVDIYSLGLVLYEMCNGMILPFAEQGDMDEARRKRLEEGCVFPNAKNASAALNRVLHKACAYQPEKRYQSAAAFQDALRSVLKGMSAGSSGNSGRETSTRKDLQQSFLKKLEQAKQGDKEAQLAVAGCYYNGRGVQKNLMEAAKWCRLSAAQGYAMAQLGMGNLYYAGTGVEQNFEKAVSYFFKSAEQNNGDAQYNLARCYEEGYGVAKNKMRAYLYYEEALKNGCQKAKAKLDSLAHEF